MKHIPWTTHQLARLRKAYPVASREDLEAEFAPHHWGAIQSMAIHLKIKRLVGRNNWLAICAAHKPVFDFGRSVFK